MPKCSTRRCSRRPTSSRAGTAATADGCGTRSRLASPSRARRRCCAAPPTSRDETGTYWQTHIAEDRGEIDEVARLFPDALDYTDVYDRAGGLGPHTLLAHAIHLSDREVARLAEAGAMSRIARRRTCFSRRAPCRSAATSPRASRSASARTSPRAPTSRSSRRCVPAPTRRTAVARCSFDPEPPCTPIEWLALGSLGGARALGLDDADRLDRGRQGGGPHPRRPVAHRAAARRPAAAGRPRGRGAGHRVAAHLPHAS